MENLVVISKFHAEFVGEFSRVAKESRKARRRVFRSKRHSVK